MQTMMLHTAACRRSNSFDLKLLHVSTLMTSIQVSLLYHSRQPFAQATRMLCTQEKIDVSSNTPRAVHKNFPDVMLECTAWHAHTTTPGQVSLQPQQLQQIRTPGKTSSTPYMLPLQQHFLQHNTCLLKTQLVSMGQHTTTEHTTLENSSKPSCERQPLLYMQAAVLNACNDKNTSQVSITT
jgi:hypothetical protein